MEKILITGGCGFIGANLVAYLSKRGPTKIRVFDNESLGKRKAVAGFDVEFVQGDLRDYDSVREAVEGVDAIVHLAADTRVMDSIENPTHNFQTNVLGTFNLLRCMCDAGVNRLVNASTGGAIVGEQSPPVHEEMMPAPLSPYGASKLSCEGYCSAFSSAYGLRAISLRFSNVYGPRSYHKGSVVAKFFKGILSGKEFVVNGDGTQTRDYVYVDDICAGIEKALISERTGVYQLGTGKPTSINRLLEMVDEIVGQSYCLHVRYGDFRPGEVRNTWCDIGKARRELHYEPKVSIEEGLRKTWNWFLESDWQKDDFS